MKKKLLTMVLAGAMTASLLAGCGGTSPAAETAPAPAAETPAPEAKAEAPAAEAPAAEEPAADAASDVDYGSGEIKIWVADNVVDFTKEKAEGFIKDHPEFGGYTILVEATGEGDAASKMITDVTAGADIYGFAQDQIARLVTAGALEEVEPGNAAKVESENAAGVVNAGKVGDTLYAYPMTADNGYFLYYDKSVIKDPSTLEGIIADCEAAGKNLCMDLGGWYQTAFFFGTGCTLTYDTDDAGNFTKCNIDYDSDKGLAALKGLVAMAASKSFVQGSSAGDLTNYAAIVDGTWDAGVIQETLGDNYACAKLPTFTVDGQTYQMSGFNGCKLLGVKPQEDEGKLAVCDALADYLTSEEVQLARFNAVGWGPSNIAAQNSAEVKADPALSALSEQFAFTIPQGNYPGDYWTLAESLRDSIVGGDYKNADDAALQAALKSFQDSCISYAK
ncbi:MAG: extracellular solute-binding protein [Lachnospiraceae bacterium]|nr:extracellular solute-binding protein [Lachnospiraceae bacterium]